jgi:hypothetical protein
MRLLPSGIKNASTKDRDGKQKLIKKGGSHEETD